MKKYQSGMENYLKYFRSSAIKRKFCQNRHKLNDVCYVCLACSMKYFTQFPDSDSISVSEEVIL